jgi:hypothetical protein
MRKKFFKRWDTLPKEFKVLPYVAVSGAVVALIDYLGELNFDDKLLMAFINIVLVFLAQLKGRIGK